jgi:hypothetical protein
MRPGARTTMKLAGILTSFLISHCEVAAQSPQDVAGTYKFVSETRDTGGQRTEIHAKGVLVLDADGQ